MYQVFEFSYKKFPATFNDSMPFSSKVPCKGRNSTRILFIELAAFLQGSPIWGNPPGAFRRGFLGGVGGDPGENPGRDGAADRSAMSSGKRGTDLVDGGQASARHSPHKRVHFLGRGNDHRPFAPAGAHVGGDRFH